MLNAPSCAPSLEEWPNQTTTISHLGVAHSHDLVDLRRPALDIVLLPLHRRIDWHLLVDDVQVGLGVLPDGLVRGRRPCSA